VKDSRYAHQREFLISVDDPERNGSPLKLEIGPIRDIAWMTSASGVRNLNF